MYIEYYLKFLHSIILYCLLLLCHFASSKLRITSSTFFKNCSMYIEYYLSIFSSVSLYYSLILCKIIVTVLFYCAMSNPKTLATSSSSLPSFHLYIFQCARVKEIRIYFYKFLILFGGAKESRTPDLLLARQAL